ncbi:MULTISPECIES: hypothetical protein [Brevibacterium]|uniref:Asp23/Gls24 family envelope stress response protein n=1 Tax=Brevibacterium salitolerans TaxID=1403566 RepID=A0ABP5IHP5_9MICO|nr:hypothetical protein [Brevibacterium sp.]
MSTDISTPRGPALPADQLVSLVEAVPGIRGMEPGIATTLRTLDARLRRRAERARFGLTIDPDAHLITVELALSGPRPVRAVVEDVQREVHEAVASAGGAQHEVLVRVQSLS